MERTSARDEATDGVPADVAPVDAAPFPRAQVWWLGSSLFGILLVMSAYEAFLPLLYLDHLDSRFLIGLLMSTDNVVGILVIPVVGLWSDRLSHPLGQRLPFIVVGAPLAAAAFLAIPSAASVLWLLIATEVLFTLFMHAHRAPAMSLMPDHVSPAQRSRGSGIVNVMGGLGPLVTYAVLGPLFDVDRRWPFRAGAIVLLVTTLVVVWRADRRPAYADMPEVTRPRGRADVAATLRTLRDPAQRGGALALASMVLFSVGSAGLVALFPVYGVTVLGLSEGTAVTVLTAFVVAFVATTLLAGLVGVRFGKVRTMRTGLIMLAVLFAGAAPVRSLPALIGLLVVAGLAWSLAIVQALPLVADLGGRTSIGLLVGLYYLATMFGQLLGTPFVGAAMDLFGDTAMFPAAALPFLAAVIVITRARRHLPAPEGLRMV